MNKGFTTTDTQTLRGNYQIPPRPKMQSRSEFSSPYIHRTNNFVKPEVKNEETKRNMKFLESVTKIYEQSGRKDLAQGIKSNLSKQKIAI